MASILRDGTSVAGTITATSFSATSLRALKDKIETFEDSALDILNDVHVVSFVFKSDPEIPKVGFIADDTVEILSGPNKDHMDIYNCVGLMMKAIQELGYKNTQLESRLAVLEDK
jgi:transcription antitermination factor NusG